MLSDHFQPHHPTSLPSDGYIPRVMPRIFTTFDLLAAHVVVIFWLINTPGAALRGTVGLIYWVIGGMFFYFPSVIATVQLGALYPHDGSLYTWTLKSLASDSKRASASLFWSFIVGICFWLMGPLALVIGANALFTFVQGIIPMPVFIAAFSHPWQQGLFMVVVCIFYNLISVQQVRVVQNLINSVFVLNLIALLLLVFAAIRWLLLGHPSATQLGQGVGWLSIIQNHPVLGLICLGYLGAPTVMALGGELSEDYKTVQSKVRAISRHAYFGMLIVFVGYILATLSLLAIRGQALASSANINFELVMAVDMGLGRLFGNIMAVCIMAFFLLSPIFYHLASSRILLVSAIDQRLPLRFGLLNRSRVPANALWLQTGVAIFLLAIVYFVVPLFTILGKSTDLVTLVYNVMLATLTLLSLLTMLFLYINLIALYRRKRSFLLERLVVPLPLLWLCMIIGPLLCLFIFVDSLLSSWTILISNYNWTLSVVVLLIVVLAIGIILSILAGSEAQWQGMRQTSGAMYLGAHTRPSSNGSRQDDKVETS